MITVPVSFMSSPHIGHFLGTFSVSISPDITKVRPFLVPVMLQFQCVFQFQSTPLHEGRRKRGEPIYSDKMFQSMSLHEGRFVVVLRVNATRVVSIHAQTRGRHTANIRAFFANEFQSTPLHEGRHVVSAEHSPAFLVSIHAPTRGATTLGHLVPTVVLVSIHVPTREATIISALLW